MKFSAAYLALAFAAAASAAPTTTKVPADQVHLVLQHLDSQNAIQWTADGEGQTAIVLETQLLAGFASLGSANKGDPEPQPPKADWKKITKQVAGATAEYVCLNYKDSVSADTVKSQVTGACAKLAKTDKRVLAADKAWSLYKKGSDWFFAEAVSKGQDKSIVEKTCEAAYDTLLDQACKGKDGKDDGAILKLAKDFYFGYAHSRN